MKSSGFLLLQQNDFLSNYVGSFQELRTAEELFDVTLACEDETVEAHKVVMSACSPFFRHVFNKTKQNHPFVYLKGILYKDLVSLLDYIYTGEAQVLAEDVDRFIDIGREMKITGLSEYADNLDRDNSRSVKTQQSPSRKMKNEELEENEMGKINPLDYMDKESSLLKHSTDEELGISKSLSQLEMKITGMIETQEQCGNAMSVGNSSKRNTN